MITEVTKYETNDGKTFDTIELAQVYLLDKVREMFDGFLCTNPKFITESDRFETICASIPNLESAIKLMNKLKNILE